MPYSSRWGVDLYKYVVAFPYDEVRVTHTGFYNSPSAGLGRLHIVSDTGQSILVSSDAHTHSGSGQSLVVGGMTLYSMKTVNWTNRTDMAYAPKSQRLSMAMNGFTNAYPYTRRYIKSLYVR